MKAKFLCPTCGLQEAAVANDFVVCPICEKILSLGAKIENRSIQAEIKKLEEEKQDLSEKYEANARGKKNHELEKAIFEKMKINKQKLDDLKALLQ